MKTTANAKPVRAFLCGIAKSLVEAGLTPEALDFSGMTGGFCVLLHFPENACRRAVLLNVDSQGVQCMLADYAEESSLFPEEVKTVRWEADSGQLTAELGVEIGGYLANWVRGRMTQAEPDIATFAA